MHKFSFALADYSNAELTHLHFIYDRANGIATEVRLLYGEVHLNRQILSHPIFGGIH